MINIGILRDVWVGAVLLSLFLTLFSFSIPFPIDPTSVSIVLLPFLSLLRGVGDRRVPVYSLFPCPESKE